MNRSGTLRLWLREPLLHFLVVGLALFLFFAWSAGDSGERRIVVSKGRIESLAAAFARTWQRRPTAAELGGLIDDYVREELAVREALSLGLDRDDTIIRRRLRQKLEFLVEDSVDAAPPTDQELGTWLQDHPDSFRIEPRAALRHVYFSADKRGDATATDASAAMAKLTARGADADASRFGDPSLLPSVVPLSPRSAIAREFGEMFAQRVFEMEAGRWQGPVESAYGLHVVFVEKREPAYLPSLAEVRTVVERDLVADRRNRHLSEVYEELRERYQVVVEPDTEKRE